MCHVFLLLLLLLFLFFFLRFPELLKGYVILRDTVEPRYFDVPREMEKSSK